MTCDKCKKDSETGRSFTWVLLPRTERRSLYQPTDRVVRYEIAYEPLERLQIHFCPGCFSKSRRTKVVLWTLASLLFLSSGAFLLWPLYIAPPSSDVGKFAVVGFVALLGLFGAVFGVRSILLFKRRGTDWEVGAVLESRLEKELENRKDGTTRDWHYMGLEAVLKFGKTEPLSSADCEAFMKVSQRYGQRFDSKYGQPVSPKGV